MKSTAIPDTHERFVNIDGAINLRDFGGYHNDEGKLVCIARLTTAIIDK